MAKKPTEERPDLVEQLRDAIRDSGQTLTRLGALCGVGKDRLSRFLRGERDLTLAAVAKICRALRLRLAPEEGEPPAGGEGPSAPGPKGTGRKRGG
jgi:hypothetical protein